MRLRNDSGYPIFSPDLGRVIDPGPEEFESPVYITGCTQLDAPKPIPPDAEDGSTEDRDGGQFGDEDDTESPGMREAANTPGATEGVKTPADEAAAHAGEHPPTPPAAKGTRRAASKGDPA